MSFWNYFSFAFLNVVSPSILYPSNLFDMKRRIKKSKRRKRRRKTHRRKGSGQARHSMNWRGRYFIKSKWNSQQMCFKTVSPGGNTYLHPSLLLLLLRGIMGPFRLVLLNRKVAPACSSVGITTDMQRLSFLVSPYFCLGLTAVNYKVDTIYLQKYKLILIV